MTNRFDPDKPGKGLSKLQKAMLVWIHEDSERMRSKVYKRPFAVWTRRPQWYGKPVHAPGLGWRSRTVYGETPAVSRALKRLVDRGLVSIIRPGHKSRHVYLNDAGWTVARRLIEDGATSHYHKQDRDFHKRFVSDLLELRKPTH